MPILSPFLLWRGEVQFGPGAGGSDDPVYGQTGAPKKSKRYGRVTIDGHPLLRWDRSEVALGFAQLVLRVVEEAVPAK